MCEKEALYLTRVEYVDIYNCLSFSNNKLRKSDNCLLGSSAGKDTFSIEAS